MFNLSSFFATCLQQTLRALPALLLAFTLSGRADAQGGCVCTNCPQFMPDGFTGNFYIQIDNAANPVLGQNGQGVCGVRLTFDHEYLGDLQIVLTSPGGQSVTLIGPIGIFPNGFTDFTNWDVTFLPCGDPVSPDPGFADQWNNNQPWGTFGNYSGSYYPFNGCLENFNSGPVNGLWTLTVTDGQGEDVGNFYNYEIIFCDPSGIECFSCAASAGNLLQPDVTACEGSASLNLNLPPTFTPPASPAPAPEYGYTYVIGGSGGVIQGYEPGPDLSAYPAGAYTVCGLSYLSAQEGEIPPPDGSLTISQLSTQLNSTTPPFCGKITANCVNVTINPDPDDMEEFQTVCAPQCYLFYNQTYCQSGTYVRNFVQNGCPYTATLHLTVLQPDFVTVNETICPDGCSQTPGFESACTAGTYMETFMNEAGCDSTVTLNVSVMNIVAVIAQPVPELTCGQPGVTLQGTGSTTGPGTTYLWTASNGGHLAGPNGGIGIEVNAPGTYQLLVCRTVAGASCCDSASVTVSGDQSLPATPGAIAGPGEICPGQADTFAVTPVPGATGYTWTVPAGVVISSGQNTPSIAVVWNGSSGGNVCVAAVNDCGNSAETCLPVSLLSQPVPAVPQGNTVVCSGNTATYSIPAANGAVAYNWTVTPPAVILSGQGTPQITVDWSAASTATVCVHVGGACGLSADSCLSVTVGAQPTANAGTDGTVCDTVFNLQATVSVPGSAGVWALVTGSGLATFANVNAASTTVTVDQAGAYVFSWTETNGLCSDTDSVSVLFNSAPSTGLIGNVCDGGNQNYTVSFPVSGGTPPYSVPGGAVANGIFVSDPIPSGQPYSFTVTDANGCTAPALAGLYDCSCSTNAGQMDLQPLTACAGGTVAAQHAGGATLDTNDVAAYVLHDSPGPLLGTVFAQNETGIFSFQNGMSYGTTYYVSYIAGNNLNGQPDPTDPCLSVAQGQSVTFLQNPAPNAGVDADTCGLSLSLQGSATAGTGLWTSLDNGLSIDIPQNASATATAAAAGQYLAVWTVTENGCTGSDTVALQFNPLPAAPAITRTCDAANENYTVTLVLSGGTAPYTVNGNPVTGNTFVSSFIPNNQSYSFTVADANGCALAPVAGAYSCDCATGAGVMSGDTLEVCEGNTATVAPNSVPPALDGNDTIGYVLHDGTGTVLGQVFARNTSGEFGLEDGMIYGQVYRISLVAGNNLNGFPDPDDPCLAVAAGQPVVFRQNPIPYAGSDTAVCGLSAGLKAVGVSFSGSWAQVGGPGAATFANLNDQNSLVTVPASGTYVFQWAQVNGSCVGADSVTLIFREIPTVGPVEETCNAGGMQFTVSFQPEGGTAPYQVTGLSGSFAGNLYTSGPLPGGSTYSFMVTDANGCSAPEISGQKNCNCATDAGTMSATPLLYCAGDTAVAIWNSDGVLDAGDTLLFILHDQAGPQTGNILGSSPQPVFPFADTLLPGVTYYISAVAGSILNGSVNWNDSCLSVSSGTPVQWKALPAASLSGDTVICAAGSAALTFSGSGAFPLTLSYSDGSGTPNVLIINGPAPVVLPVSPDSSVVYILVSVNDGGTPVCSALPGDTVQVTVNRPPDAGTANEPVELCAGTNLPLQLINFLTGADPGGQWTETSAVPSLPGAFNAATGTFETAGQPAGTYTFRYVLTGQPPCGSDEETATVVLLGPPVADAGEDQALNCDQTAVLLGGDSTSTGPNLDYLWLFGADSVGSTAQIFSSQPGTYILVVSHQAGCSASDEVNVTLDNDPPIIEAVTVTPVRCFGEQSGVISIDSVTSTHPPLLYALDAGAFSPNRIFNNLAPGDHTVTIVDANGCETISAVLTVNEPVEIKIELGPDVQAALGDSVYLQVLSSVPVTALDTILWNPLLDSAAAGKDFQYFLAVAPVKVRVAVRDSNGCTAEDELWVYVNKARRVFIPNIFNPGSSENPILQVYGGRDVAEVEIFRIYDRWGGQVFEALDRQPNDPASGWDGRQKGKAVAPGVYVYYAVVRFVDGQQETFRGDVTVYR